METIDILRNLWFILIGVLFAGYSILDGFDLGIGMLMPFIGKSDKSKRSIIKTIWPFWDGNEVWLIAGAGALFAAFPLAYAGIFSRFYLLFMIVLFALIFRAVSLEFYYYDEARKKIWANAFAIGSFIPPLLLGILMGNILIGFPMEEGAGYVVSFSILLRPFPILTGILVVLTMLIHGGLYLNIKTQEELQQKAIKAVSSLWLFLLIAFVIGTISIPFFINGNVPNALYWINSVIVLIFIVLLRSSIKKEKGILSFLFSSLILLGYWTSAGILLYPDLLRGLVSENNLTIFNASSGKRTLSIMLIVAVIGMPIVIAYTVYVYRVFRGKVSSED